MAVITISRQFGAGGLTLGKAIADMLGYTFASDEIIKMVAEKARVSENWVKMVEKEAGGRLQKLLGTIVPKNLIERVLDERHGYFDEEIFIDLLHDIITKIAEEGNCLILGRGGQYILRDYPDTIHVLLIGDKNYRVGFMQEKYKLSLAQATQAVNNGDKRRINLYRKFNKSDYDLPAHYHLTINMSKVSLQKAAQTVRCMVSQNML
ncbi:MAG: cytidylate kinase-like family protein [Desulfatitalea sp.]|nr:cytidylate kinase-like family protein [Desulfatitalea sp.]NNJ98816.1 cytidylate kinase-like family protein [Desulfatitalea sp.]